MCLKTHLFSNLWMKAVLVKRNFRNQFVVNIRDQMDFKKPEKTEGDTCWLRNEQRWEMTISRPGGVWQAPLKNSRGHNLLKKSQITGNLAVVNIKTQIDTKMGFVCLY